MAVGCNPRARRLSAACLDFFEGELAVHPEMQQLADVVPNIASASLATRRAMADLAADRLIAALLGGTPPTALNAQMLRPGADAAPRAN